MEDDRGNSSGGRETLPPDWVDEHADALYRFALRKISDRHVIEDLLQETYLAAFKSKHLFRGDSSLRTWLIAILRLKIIDHYRAQARLAKTEKPTPPVKESAFRGLRLSAWNCDPKYTLENQEFWSVFQDCVEKLPATLARAFLMRELDGCDSEQVCAQLEITNENLAVRTFRARSAMRDCLDKHWFARE